MAIAAPNFTAPTEQAQALTVRNNLLGIYTAQQNYINNNPAGRVIFLQVEVAVTKYLILITTVSFEISIQIMVCIFIIAPYQPSVRNPRFVRQRGNNSTSDPQITLTLSAPIKLSVTGNPACASSNSWCP